MNDLVDGISIGGPKTPKRAQQSTHSHSHDGGGVNRAVYILVCITLAETVGDFFTGINNYMAEAVDDAPSINSFICQSDLWRPYEKQIYFEVPSGQMAQALLPHLQKKGGRIESTMLATPTSEHDLFPGIPIAPTNVASFYRVIGCARHNSGIPCFPESLKGYNNTYAHGLVLHRAFLAPFWTRL